MTKKVVFAVVALVVVASAIGWWWNRNRAESDGEIVLYGNVDIRQVELAFKISERIVHMYAREGQLVKQGELVADLETSRATQSLRLAEAQMAAQAQQLAQLEAGSRVEDLDRLQAELDAARAQAHNLERNARRLRDLAQRKLASEEQVDNADAARDAAQGQVRAAEAALRLAQVGPRQEELAQARAQLQAAQAQVELARETLQDTRLHAPVDGVVRDRIAEPGDMAAPGKPVYSIALVDPIWVRSYIPETQLGRIHPGQPVEVRTDSFPDKPYRGWIGYISPTAEFTPKSVETTEVRSDLVYQVRVYVCNPNHELRLGMPATVVVPNPGTAADRPATGDPCLPAS